MSVSDNESACFFMAKLAVLFFKGNISTRQIKTRFPRIYFALSLVCTTFAA